MSHPTADVLAKFNERFGNSIAADAYARRMDCEDVAAFVPLLQSDSARTSWREAHNEDCEDGCRTEPEDDEPEDERPHGNGCDCCGPGVSQWR